MKVQRFIERLKSRVSKFVFQLSQGPQQLDRVRQLDRALAQITHRRERLLGELAHDFLHSSISSDPPNQFLWIIEEIRQLEEERKQQLNSNCTSVSTLIVPQLPEDADPNHVRLELMSQHERSELYRQRLRGLYLDLSDMLLNHHLIEYFPEAHNRIVSIQTELNEVKQQREALQILLPSSAGVLLSLKTSVLVAVSLLIVWIWI